ncbi:SDR family oxidoreductase [Nocardioides sp. dk4132]|uniref:SDR family NAD(P)-dependent oxidoreductase n=1 Tax=unclassified Nocardioides TaxID=2615069 RepID=UPI001294BD48|nr:MULTISPECIES: SDR family NAD(P)-dependent oxidoreductase [unclassified Nocardioides]MQW78027.1 SDR family oxidoreductase [Nocardioides sp. dk4132]QGA08134.1 SDR family oxidoreductase [Nocardioides sp. dk884]
MSAPLIDLTGKVALVTGAARGQGAAEAELFVDLGATVVLTDVLAEEVGALAKRLGDRASHHRHDTSSSADWARVLEAVRAEHGRLDVLVNNAGVYRTGDLTEWPEQDLRALLDVNLLGPVLGMQVAVPLMPRGSSIVNVASISGLRGHDGALPYAASKWGLRGASRSAARELGPRGIRVNCVCPGSVDTPMIASSTMDLSHLPIPRRGTAEEVAAMVAFLASDASAYTTGADFVVDGGATA